MSDKEGGSDNQEKMDAFLAVFNCHVNNAQKRANQMYIRKYGIKKFRTDLCPLFRKGIMVIFREKATDDRKQWVKWVHRFVNEPASNVS